MPRAAYLVIGALSWPAVHLLYRLEARGVENLPREGGFVLAANHLSNFDPWPLAMPLFPRRELRFMGKSELFNPVLGPVLRATGAFPVRRGRGDMEAIRTAIELVRSGEVLVMFPEGTRRAKGVRKRFEAKPHSGTARIALEAGAPVVPAAVAGTDGLSRLAKLRVRYGEPMEVVGLSPAEATARMMTRIHELEATL